jgi:hypothetical protein
LRLDNEVSFAILTHDKQSMSNTIVAKLVQDGGSIISTDCCHSEKLFDGKVMFFDKVASWWWKRRW